MPNQLKNWSVTVFFRPNGAETVTVTARTKKGAEAAGKIAVEILEPSQIISRAEAVEQCQ